MRLGIDFDGTITDAATMQRSYAARRWGVQLTELQVMRGGAVPILGEARYRTMGNALWGPLTAFTPPQDGALATLARLAEDHELTVITARHGHEAAFARRWLAARGLDIRVMHTSAAPKGAICAALGIDALLDDDIATHAATLRTAGTLPVLLALPHNQPQPPAEGVRSVESWPAFGQLVEELVRSR